MNLVEGVSNRLLGGFADEQDIERLKLALPSALIPEWLLHLFRSYRLAGANFSISEGDDLSSVGVEMIWLSIKQIISEAIDAEPGLSILPLGFLPVGACAIGSGDPYFLDLNGGTDNPALVRVPHEYAGNGLYPLEQTEIVSLKLSDFFDKALIS